MITCTLWGSTTGAMFPCMATNDVSQALGLWSSAMTQSVDVWSPWSSCGVQGKPQERLLHAFGIFRPCISFWDKNKFPAEMLGAFACTKIINWFCLFPFPTHCTASSWTTPSWKMLWWWQGTTSEGLFVTTVTSLKTGNDCTVTSWKTGKDCTVTSWKTGTDSMVTSLKTGNVYHDIIIPLPIWGGGYIGITVSICPFRLSVHVSDFVWMISPKPHNCF